VPFIKELCDSGLGVGFMKFGLNGSSNRVLNILPRDRTIFLLFLEISCPPSTPRRRTMYLSSGSSIYDEIQALYWRQPDGKLLAVEGKRAEEVGKAWPMIWEEVETHSDDRKKLILPSGGRMESLQLHLSCLVNGDDSIRPLFPLNGSTKREGSESALLRVQELYRACQDEIVGVLSLLPPGVGESMEFRDWAGLLILSETRFLSRKSLGISAACKAKARECSRLITDIFEQTIQNVAPNDQWITCGGRKYFEGRVFGFTERQCQVEFCLPAFPCKSSNSQKTNSVHPDQAEKIALDVLRSFAQSVAAIYEPGARIWIISDGHVFSDCSELLFHLCYLDTWRALYLASLDGAPLRPF
jgi:Pyoverdine/dityrosine biosynthesis protein